MVRLSLIVLGLLAAVWCFSGTTEGVRVRRYRGAASLSCGRGRMIKVEKCYKIRSSCPRVTYSSGSVKCVSWRWARIVKRCTRRRLCWVSRRISKGRYACKYRCVRRSRPRRKGRCHWTRFRGRHCHSRRRRRNWTRRCHTYRGRRYCHRYRKRCRTRWGRRRCRLYRRGCYRRSYRRYKCRRTRQKRCHRSLFRRRHCHWRKVRKCGYIRISARRRCRWIPRCHISRRRGRHCH